MTNRTLRLMAALLVAYGSAWAAGSAMSAAALKSLDARVTAVESTLPDSARFGPGPLASAKLALRKAGELHRAGGDERRIAEVRKRVEAFLEQVGREDVAGPPETGFRECAYISRIDGNAEPYLLYVPKSYTPEKSWPLLVFLHGYYGGLNPLNWIQYMYSSDLEEVCEREGVILLMPFGRSNTEFMGVGESDVLEALEYAQAEYRVDPNRIILSGASMGGSGAWSIACHSPHRFAAVAVITARVDYYLWMNIRPEDYPRFKQIQVDTDYARLLLPNLRHVPLLIFYGDQDSQFVQQSKRMLELARPLGLNCTVTPFENEGHYIWGRSFTHANFVNLLRTARRPEAPREVSLNTLTLKYPRAYWVEIESIPQWGRLAEVRAEADGEGAIRLTCSNVGRLLLGPGVPGVAAPGKATVLANGKPVPVEPLPDGRLRVTLSPEANKAGLLRKSPGRVGPIREVYDAPFVIVYPSRSGSGAVNDRNNAVRLAREWMGYAQGVPAFIPDSQVTDRHIRDCNLVICGGPETNTLMARMAGRLPIRISADHYEVGERRFPSAGCGLQFVYPNPLNPKRLVLVVHGVPWGPQLQVNHKLDFLPDFIVYTDKTVKDGTWFPTNASLCAGYFDMNWQFSEASTWLGAVAPANAGPGDGGR